MANCQSLTDICILRLALEHDVNPYGHLFLPRRLRMCVKTCISSLEHFEAHFKGLVDLRQNTSNVVLKASGEIDVDGTVRNFQPGLSKADFLVLVFYTGADFDWKDLYTKLSGEDRKQVQAVAYKDTFVLTNWMVLLGIVHDIGYSVFQQEVRKCVEFGATATLLQLLKGVGNPSKEGVEDLFKSIPKPSKKLTRLFASVFPSSQFE
ncbi:hypothetical protein QR680_014023 [Steinernema hermaphroditum]|uniref:Uncharacterized protein n=1 Tax=Steinernema hermaphroditum TaxID=289476 RepID=A0AA39M2I3_9BILA|nr:hypothetical protein QR680_014023 [Steinernema hermaphroditum]